MLAENQLAALTLLIHTLYFCIFIIYLYVLGFQTKEAETMSIFYYYITSKNSVEKNK